MRKRLTNFGLTLGLLVLAASCSTEEPKQEVIHDARFCECMEAAEKLNDYSSKLLERTPTAEDEKMMQELRAENERLCKAYYRMSGEEMLKRKAACK